MAAIPLEVTEWMKGYIGLGAKDYDAGFIEGVESNTYFVHQMVIHIEDVDRFVADPKHPATMNGTIQCEALGGTRPCTDATFNMFVDTKDPKLKYMRYRMPFTDGQGRRKTLLGHKTIHDDHTLDLWSDTTTLYVRIFEGDAGAADEPTAAPAAMGIIHIEKLDLIRSLRSGRSPGSSPAASTRAMTTFARFFLGKLWEVFGKFGRVTS